MRRQSSRRSTTGFEDGRYQSNADIDETSIDMDSFAYLQKVNVKRRGLIKRSYLTGIDILLQYRHTLLGEIIRAPVLYVTAVTYWLGRLIIDDLSAPSQMSLAAVTLSSTFVSFLLVFFFTQSYSRFWLQYEAAMGCKGRIFDAILLARTCMDLSSSMKLFRYMNAAHLLGYVGMGESYTATNFFFPINDIYHLLSESEVERIKAIGFKGGSAHREVIAWAVKVIKQQNLSRGISDHDSTTLMGEVFAFRARMAALYDFSEQPIPFSYIHFIKLIIFIYLPLFGFGVALNFSADKSGYWTESVFGFLLVLFFSMALIGTRELAQRLQDPLGHDMEDLSVLHYVTFNIEQSRRILLAEDSHALNDSAEIALSERRERNLSDEAFVVRTSSLESILGSLGKSSFSGSRHMSDSLQYAAVLNPMQDSSEIDIEVGTS